MDVLLDVEKVARDLSNLERHHNLWELYRLEGGFRLTRDGP